MKILFLLTFGLNFLDASQILPYMMDRQYGITYSSEVLFDDFASFIFERFEPNLIEELVEDILKLSMINKPPPISRSKKPKGNPSRLYSSISLFSNLKFSYFDKVEKVYKETSIQKLLSTEESSPKQISNVEKFYRIFSRFQGESTFIDEIVAKFRAIAIQNDPSYLFSTYYFIKILPVLENTFKDVPSFPFADLCNLFLSEALHLDTPLSRQIILARPEVDFIFNNNPQFAQNFLEGGHLLLTRFSQEEIILCINLIKLFIGTSKSIVFLPENKQVQALFSRESCILKAFVVHRDNILIQRLVDCISICLKYSLVDSYRVKMIHSFFNRLHLLSDLDSSLLWAIMRYLTNEFEQSELSKDYNAFSKLSIHQKDNLDRFLRCNGFTSVSFNSVDPKVVKESIIRLGVVPGFQEPSFLFAKLLSSYFINPQINIFLKSKIFTHSQNPDDLGTLEEFLELQDPLESIFCIFAHPNINVHSTQIYMLIYYVSKLVDALAFPGSESLVEFVLLYVKSPALLHRIFTNLQKAFEGQPYDFSFMIKLFPEADQDTLELYLNPKTDFGTWCNYFLNVLMDQFQEREFYNAFFDGYQLHPSAPQSI
jgi:hypothetical protein